MENIVAKLVPNTPRFPLLRVDTTPPPTHTVSNTRTLRPRSPRLATPEHASASRKRVHTQEKDTVQEHLLPRKRGKSSGTAMRNDRDGSAGVADTANDVGGDVGTRVSRVRRSTRQTGDVVVKAEATSTSVLLPPMVEGGVSGSAGGGGLLPTREAEVEVGSQGNEDVKVEGNVEVKEEVKMEVKMESSDDEDAEYTGNDEDEDEGEDDGGSEDSDRGGGDVHSTVQLTATQRDTGMRTRRNPWVSASNPHGFWPTALARLQELSPEARERRVKVLLQQREWDAKRWSDPAVRQVLRVRNKMYRENNAEKLKQQFKEYREKNKEQVKQRAKEYREKNKEKVKQRAKEYREKNKEKVKQREKEYYEKNKEKVKQRAKEYREKNKEKVKQGMKEYREKNKEQVKQRAKEYREKNKEKVRERQKEWREKKREQCIQQHT